ncbi:hypothetical protein C3736_13770 [Escherichia coli]|nr:hypothetical protein ECB_02038 [Escherichia coli B str. REL606]ACT43862.1 hypothetical protein ECD_02038 [Escherichia coli BL21(DE3)]ARH97785.1 hypothetical protein B5762_02203 [Escherichia coli]AVM05966.1 hypothetical protein C6P57_20385 [Escherichia coli]POT01945.1 hypothetical protein C3735_13775 [Escherichia coli]
MHESRRYRVRCRLFHERYGADRGANQRRNRSLARRVPTRDNGKRILKIIFIRLLLFGHSYWVSDLIGVPLSKLIGVGVSVLIGVSLHPTVDRRPAHCVPFHQLSHFSALPVCLENIISYTVRVLQWLPVASA